MEKFIVEQSCTAVERPTLEGNGFKGLSLDGDKHKAKKFLSVVTSSLFLARSSPTPVQEVNTSIVAHLNRRAVE